MTCHKVTPKEQAKIVNLSGKSTLVGRTSGECLPSKPPTKHAFSYDENVKLSGSRTEISLYIREISIFYD